ncbi:exosome complex RNA-binding protein Csl4 [Candidatus Bathyarchaeota archaeon]|jgi:exosome complex component CSL4|nr:exosome complex RNA-binding protein Csl4 [Candidatus Bathyarchaeota archaeon]
MSSKPSEQKTGQIVVPGERLGVIEEFIPDAGTYVNDGVIYSKVVGRALVDLVQKRVSVHELAQGAKIPKVGSTVMGQVSSSKSETAGVRIFEVSNKKSSNAFAGILHVSDVQMQYVDSMFDICKPGDIIRAKVISTKNRTYHLSTKDKDLGVIYAFCSSCGGLLEPRRQGMHCPKCGRIERRKTTRDYGKGIM